MSTYEGIRKVAALLLQHAENGVTGNMPRWLIDCRRDIEAAASTECSAVKPLLGTRFKLTFNKAGNCTNFYRSQREELEGKWVWLIDATDGVNKSLYSAPDTQASQYAYERDLARRERDEVTAERDRFVEQAMHLMAQYDRLKRATKALCEAYAACNGEDDDAYVTARLLCMGGVPAPSRTN